MPLRDQPHSVEIDETGVSVFESRHSTDFAMSLQRWQFDKLGKLLGMEVVQVG